VAQQAPYILASSNAETGIHVDFCVVTFPGIEYILALPPWPIADELWNIFGKFKLVSRPGHTSLDPEELRITRHRKP